MPSACTPAFTTTHRVIYRVHRRSANVRPTTHVSFTSSFTDTYALVLCVSYLTNRRPASRVNHSGFAGWQDQVRVITFS